MPAKQFKEGSTVMTERSLKPIAATVAALLAQRHMSQADLWRAAGLDRATVSRYISGDRADVTDTRAARTIEKIAAALEVEPDYFLEYRRWRVQSLALAHPDFVDDFYNLIMEMARVRGFLDEGPDSEGI